MHDTNDDERGVARPNDEVRAAVLEALDYADRAGVKVTCVTGLQYGGDPAVQIHASQVGNPSQPMPHTDALRILLRAARASEVATSDPRGGENGGRWHVVHTAAMRSGVNLHVFAQPSPVQLEAAVVEAVLQS